MVYFIQAKHEGGPIKIGYSSNPAARLKSIQTACPYEMCVVGELSGGHKEEADWHDILECHRLHGEWYAPSRMVVERIARAMEDERQ